jgi:glycosyltransferase involved in cell wall biosynthesis
MGIPVVWHVREPFGQHPLLSPLMQKMIRLLSHSIVVNSDYVAREFPNCAYVYRVYNGVDLSRFDPYKVKRDRIRSELGISSDEPLIGMISVIARVKGHLVLLQAAPRVLEEFPSAKFLIVGGSPLPMGYHKTWRGRIRRLLGQEVDDEANLRSTVREAGLEKSFVFTGFRRDVPEILADLDLLVFPSIVPEGFGRPLIEAGAMEVPVVASRLGPHPEIVLDGETGLLVPPNDSDALAESILTLLRNPAYTRQLGKAARQRVSKLFSLESYVSGIEQVLRHVEL